VLFLRKYWIVFAIVAIVFGARFLTLETRKSLETVDSLARAYAVCSGADARLATEANDPKPDFSAYPNIDRISELSGAPSKADMMLEMDFGWSHVLELNSGEALFSFRGRKPQSLRDFLTTCSTIKTRVDNGILDAMATEQ
jgi:hypothetical protein